MSERVTEEMREMLKILADLADQCSNEIYDDDDENGTGGILCLCDKLVNKIDSYVKIDIERTNNKWISKNEELPNVYEEVEVLIDDGHIRKDMIVRGKYGNLEWRDHADMFIKAWRKK